MNKKIVFFLAALSILALGSCNKYLYVTPKGYQLLSTVADHDQWLNDPAIAINYHAALDQLTDNFEQFTLVLLASMKKTTLKLS